VLGRIILRKGEFCPVILVQLRYSSMTCLFHDRKVRVFVFITIFNNKLIRSWWSVLLVAETVYPDKTTDLSIVTDKFYHIILYRVHLPWGLFELTPLLVINTDWTGNQYIEQLFICVVNVSGLSLFNDWLIYFLCLAPISAIFELYHGDQLSWWKKPEYPERTTDNGQATGKLYHLRLRIECTLFVIYKTGREPMPYWW
jgi:hypothetical protein